MGQLIAARPGIGNETMLDIPSGQADLAHLPRRLPGDERLHFALIDFERELRAINESIFAIRSSWFYQDPPDKDQARNRASELTLVLQRLRGAVAELQRAMAPTTP
jgi:hypothetical protein